MSKSLRSRIEDGEFRSGDLFPSEENLNKSSKYLKVLKKEGNLNREVFAVQEEKKKIIQSMKDEYRQDERNKRVEFRQAVEEEYGTTKWPKEVRDKIWNKAWEDGHAEGFANIECHYEELADFTHEVIGAAKQK